jgi:hypothetical protein
MASNQSQGIELGKEEEELGLVCVWQNQTENNVSNVCKISKEMCTNIRKIIYCLM